MLHILTIAVRQIIYAFALAIKNLWALFVLHNKEMLGTLFLVAFY